MSSTLAAGSSVARCIGLLVARTAPRPPPRQAALGEAAAAEAEAAEAEEAEEEEEGEEAAEAEEARRVSRSEGLTLGRLRSAPQLTSGGEA